MEFPLMSIGRHLTTTLHQVISRNQPLTVQLLCQGSCYQNLRYLKEQTRPGIIPLAMHYHFTKNQRSKQRSEHLHPYLNLTLVKMPTEQVHIIKVNNLLQLMLMKTGLNNILLSTLFIIVNSIILYCYTWFKLIQHYFSIFLVDFLKDRILFPATLTNTDISNLQHAKFTDPEMGQWYISQSASDMHFPGGGGEFVTLFNCFHKFTIFKSWRSCGLPDSAENSLLL